MTKYLYLAVVIIIVAVSLYCANKLKNNWLDQLTPVKTEQISNNTK